MTWYNNDDNDFPDKESAKNTRKKNREITLHRQLLALQEELELETCPSPILAPKRGNLYSRYWGRAWGKHLANLSFWEQRLNRGRTLLRQGNVYLPTIIGNQLHGYISSDQLYPVSLEITPCSEEQQQHLLSLTQQNALSLLDLLNGNASDELIKQLIDEENGLFPQAHEVKSLCTCLDWADLCEHGAALLYATGLLFEQDPRQLFSLRGINLTTLATQLENNMKKKTSSQEIDTSQWEDIFQIDIRPE